MPQSNRALPKYELKPKQHCKFETSLSKYSQFWKKTTSNDSLPFNLMDDIMEYLNADIKFDLFACIGAALLD